MEEFTSLRARLSKLISQNIWITLLDENQRISCLVFVLVMAGAAALICPAYTSAHQVRDGSSESDQVIERILIQGLTRYYVEDYHGAVAVFEEGLKIQPDNPTLLASMGRAKHALGDIDAARFFLRRALNLDCENLHLWMEWVEISLELNDVEESIIALTYLIENQIPSWPSRLQLNHLLFQIERYDEALNVVDAGLHDDGPIPELLLAKAQVLEKMGHSEELAETLLELSILQHGDTDILYRLAVASMRTERWDKAEETLIELLEIDPDHERGRESYAEVLFQLGKPLPAGRTQAEDSAPVLQAAVSLADLERRVAANPDRLDLSMQLAELLFNQEEYLKAAQRYEQILLADTRNLVAWSNSIEAYAFAGEANRALELSDEALLLFPGYVPIEVAHFFALRAAGRKDEARRLAEKLIKQPTDPQFEDHIIRLKREIDDA